MPDLESDAPKLDAPRRLLGIDYGHKRVGVAASDALGITAQPVETIPVAGDMPAAIARIRAIAEDRGATHAVVGLPKNMNDTEGELAERARAFAQQLANGSGLPVVLWDERWTSRQAEQALRQSGLSRKKRKAKIDTVAAQLLLQSYLDAGTPRLDEALTPASGDPSAPTDTAGDAATDPSGAGRSDDAATDAATDAAPGGNAQSDGEHET